MAGISAILTAAGESTRVGRPKPLLLWSGVPLVEYQTRSLVEAGVAEVVVVLGHLAGDVEPYVRGPGVRHVLNRDYRRGKATSIRVGLGAISRDAEGVLLLAVDQPRPAHLVSAVILAHLESDALITSPRHRGRGGHPLVFAASLRSELEAISEEGNGIREVFERHRERVTEIEIDDPIIRLDINTLEEYERARATYGA